MLHRSISPEPTVIGIEWILSGQEVTFGIPLTLPIRIFVYNSAKIALDRLLHSAVNPMFTGTCQTNSRPDSWICEAVTCRWCESRPARVGCRLLRRSPVTSFVSVIKSHETVSHTGDGGNNNEQGKQNPWLPRRLTHKAIYNWHTATPVAPQNKQAERSLVASASCFAAHGCLYLPHPVVPALEHNPPPPTVGVS